MSTHSQLFELIGDELRLVEGKLQAPSELFEPLSEALDLLVESGGKRLRPALALLAGKLYPETPRARLISLAAAIEALHTATLVHDDLVDGSLLRRSHPTLNASWSTGATVLAGDYVFARAAYFAAETGSVRVMQIFAQTLMTIVEGELRQLMDLRNWHQTKDSYFRRIYGKTAALFAAATESAGVLGEAPEEQVAALRDYGYNLGMAFQIMDDILDFVGDERVVGKPVGSDLRQGTVTLPVYYYLQAHPDAIQVMQATGNGHSVSDALAELIMDIGRSPAIEATRAEAALFVRNAKKALDPLPASVHRDEMASLADYVVSRHL